MIISENEASLRGVYCAPKNLQLWEVAERTRGAKAWLLMILDMTLISTSWRPGLTWTWMTQTVTRRGTKES